MLVGRGGLSGTKIANNNFVNNLVFPKEASRTRKPQNSSENLFGNIPLRFLQKLVSVFGRADFSRIVIFEPDFFADVVSGFVSSFLWGKKCPDSETNTRGWKTQERGKHTIKPLPKNGFGPPPPYDTFPPPLCFRPVVFLRGNWHRPGKSHFRALQNWFWRAHSMVPFPSPKTGQFQVRVCGVTVCPFSRHKGNERPKCL